MTCNTHSLSVTQPSKCIYSMTRPRHIHQYKCVQADVHLWYMSAAMATISQEDAWWQDVAADNFCLYDQQCSSTKKLQTNLNKHKVLGYLLLPLSRLRPGDSITAIWIPSWPHNGDLDRAFAQEQQHWDWAPQKLSYQALLWSHMQQGCSCPHLHTKTSKASLSHTYRPRELQTAL